MLAMLQILNRFLNVFENKIFFLLNKIFLIFLLQNFFDFKLFFLLLMKIKDVL